MTTDQHYIIVEQTAHAVLPHAISVLKAAGYDLVTVAECMGMSPYLNIGTPQNVSISPWFNFSL